MDKESVIVYSHDHSEKSRLLKNQLDEWGIDFVEKDVKKNPEYLKELQDRGIFATPTIVIKGTYIQGLQLDRIKKELGL